MFKRIFTLLRPHKWAILIGFACLVLATPAQLFHPLVWKFVVDEVVIGQQVHYLLPALLVMFGVHLAGAGLSACRTYLLGVAGQRFVASLRERIHAKLMGQSVAYLNNRRSGDLVSRAVNDVEALQDVVVNGVDNILGNALGFLCVAGILVWLDWRVGTATLVPLVIVAFIVWVFNARVKALYRRIRDRLGDLQAHLHEHLLGFTIIKAFAREPLEQERFGAKNANYLRESIRGVRVRSIYTPSVMTVGFLSNVVMLGLGGYFAMRRDGFTEGDLVAYRGYWWHLFGPVMMLAQINEMFQRARAAGSRIFELLDAPETIEDPQHAHTLTQFAGRIEFDNVTFGYEPGRPVLEEVSFTVEPGSKLGITGPSGSGKSTILSLILRLYDVDSGALRADGQDVRLLCQSALREHMALVTQEPFLFNDTVFENIRFGRVDALPEEVEEAAYLANAHDFIAQLPQGYDTVVGERGVKLSGGQKQRLCIARAFLANPRVLLLDEATASVEAESEALIQAALERLEHGRTTIIVSHRLSLVRDCAEILVLGQGAIVERGAHEELRALNGWYARMLAIQVDGRTG
jgi:ABC-type multidrug transport system fused ATPase/permease subunit